MSTPNVEKLLETLEWVRAHATDRGGPTSNGLRWDQNVFVEKTDCGTAMCFAGARAHLDGGRPCDIDGTVSGQPTEYSYMRMPDGAIHSIEDHAIRSLGLSNSQANVLFCSDNSLRDLENIVNGLIADPTI